MQDVWQPSFTNQDVEVLDSRVVYDGHVTVLERKIRFKMFAGGMSSMVNRICVRRKKSVAVLLYDPSKDAVVMIEQLRSSLINNDVVFNKEIVNGRRGEKNGNDGEKHFNMQQSPWVLELVAGLIEDGDSEEETAYKETREEAGCEVLDLMSIGTYFVSPGITNEATMMFCARVENYIAGNVCGVLAEHEDIKVHAFPVEQAFSLLTSGRPLAAGTIIGLQWLQLNYEKLREKWG